MTGHQRVSPSRLGTLAVGLIFHVSVAGAQTRTASASFDLRDALTLARAHAPALRIVDAQHDIAAGRVKEIAQYPNPTIEYRRENLGSVLSPDIFTTVYVPFDISGRRLTLRSAGNSGAQRVAAERVANRRDGEVHIAVAWLRGAASTEMVAVGRGVVATLTEIAVVDSLRQREGIVSEAVAMRTQLEADRARVALATLIGDAARLRSELSRALGVDNNEMPVTTAMIAPPLPAAPDSTAVADIARRTRSEVVAREAGLREAQLRQRAESRGMIGDWQLQGGSKKTSGFMTGQLGLAVPLPLFNRNDGARLRARGDVREALAWRDDAVVGVQAEAVAALVAYNAVRANAAVVATFARRGRELATIARTSYSEGHSTLVELLDAERASADAQNAHIRWMVEAWMVRLELERALGARLDTDSPLDLPIIATVSNLSPTAR